MKRLIPLLIVPVAIAAANYDNAASPVAQPVSWNANVTELGNGLKKAEIFEGWANYPRSDGTWTPINPHMVSVSGGWEARDVPFAFKAPATALGEAYFEADINYDIISHSQITDAPLGIYVSSLDAVPVAGQLHDMDEDGIKDSVLYPNAFPQWSADLIYVVVNDKAPNLQKLIRFNTAPSANIDAQFRLRLSEDPDISVDETTWNRASAKAAVRGIGFRRKNSVARRGFGIRKSLIWDAGKEKTAKVALDIRQSAGDLVLTKHVKAAFFRNAVLPVFADASLTVYPDAGPSESTSTDGFVARSGFESFNSLRTGAGTTADDTSTDPGPAAYIHSVAGTWQQINRGISLFDTSSLGASATVVSATYSLYGRDAQSGISGQSAVVDRPTTSSQTSLTTSDYNLANWASSMQSDTTIATTGWSTSGYNDFPLNATGVGNINTTGITYLGIRLSGDFNNIEPSFVSNQSGNADAKGAEAAGTSQDPKLTITYTTGGGSSQTPIVINIFP